ncbi:unnamed protein product [Paramecium pentaurelia]|uniref:Uncharacterized protein n=1 Tax=Paramecium pentaurelia TaxID=43138 RepID=A0A8S1XL65_9CILI|nr:unnamed protein product [Paramecium pentaurelia]
MKINSHPEKKLEGILKQEILFKSAKKMMKELKKDIQGLPSMDYEESSANLYNFIVNRKVENTANYSTRAHPLKKTQRTLSFELIKPKMSDAKIKHLRFGSREGKRMQSRNIQKIRRRSCCCSDCGHDNTKIIHLMYKGATCHRQVEQAHQLKKKRDFADDAFRFSQKIARRMILIKNKLSSKTILFRKRCNSCDTRLSKDMLNQHKQVAFQVPQRKETHSKTQMRHTVFMKRQQTINDKLLLIPIKNLKVVSEIQLPIKTLPTQPSNTSSKILKKKHFNRTYVPVNRSILPQLSPSKFTINNNKSIDNQLKSQIRQQVKELQKPLNESKKNSIASLTNPYRNISQLDYLLKVRRRQCNY